MEKSGFQGKYKNFINLIEITWDKKYNTIMVNFLIREEKKCLYLDQTEN